MCFNPMFDGPMGYLGHLI